MDKPTIKSQRHGPTLTGPVVVGTNQTLSIWCLAMNARSPGTLKRLIWKFPNKTNVPGISKGEASNSDVYMVNYAGNASDDVYSSTWIRVLKFNGIQQSAAGNYTCVAHNSSTTFQSVEIQVSGG